MKPRAFVTEALAGIHREPAGFYSPTGRPSIDPELLMRMLIVGYCYAFDPNGVCVKRSRRTGPTDGLAGSIWMMTFRIIRASPITLRFERMRLRGLSGARDEFLMAVITQ